MENRNLILAVVLSLVILFGWGRFAEYMGWVKPAQQAEEPADKTPPPAPAGASAAPAQFSSFQPAPGVDFQVGTPFYEAVFHSGGGILNSFVLKKYHTGILPDSSLVNMVDAKTAKFAPLGIVLNSQPTWSAGQWELVGDRASLEVPAGQTASFTIRGEVDNFQLSRTFTIDADTYLIRESTIVTNAAGQPRPIRLSVTQAMDAGMSSGSRYDSMRIAWDENGKLDDVSSARTLETTGIQESGKIWWAGPMSTYFLAAVLPGNPENVTLKGRLQDTVWRVGVEAEERFLAAGQSMEFQAAYWTGPKDRAQLTAVSEQLAKSIDLGFFSIISKGLLWLLEFFYQYVHNWGVAIILLTCLINILFWPLKDKSFASMEKMKRLQPLALKIKEKYKDDKAAMNKEVMALYKTYKVNPASGCMPILIQLPVFFGLYQALLTSLALRHASFITYLPGTHVIWLADLSAQDPLYITPVLMGLTMFVQQRMSPPAADPMQQKIMLFLPLIFTVLFLNFPAGLVLYWLVNNIISIFQQWLMIRKYRKPQPEAEAPKPGAKKGGE